MKRYTVWAEGRKYMVEPADSQDKTMDISHRTEIKNDLLP